MRDARWQAEHPRPVGRRHRLLEHQLQQPRHDGLLDAQHRPARAARASASPTSTASRAAPPAAPPSSPARTRCAPGSPRSACPAPTSASAPRTRPSPSCSSRSATRPRSSARTTSATSTSTCPPTTASTSSSATSTTSTPRRSPSTRTTPRTRSSRSASDRAASSTAGRMPDGTQKIEDTGPLTKKRMETIDDEVTARTLEYLDETAAGDKPFFLWWNATRMHFRTHVKDETARRQRPGRVQRRHGRARPPRRHDPRQARRARHRRRHDRHVLDRQRPALQLLAGRRHHAVPLREEQQLGGRLPRAVLRALARRSGRRA